MEIPYACLPPDIITFQGSLDSMERGTVEWASMTNDPVPHQLIRACVRTNIIDSEQSQKGERELRIDQECIYTWRKIERQKP